MNIIIPYTKYYYFKEIKEKIVKVKNTVFNDFNMICI